MIIRRLGPGDEDVVRRLATYGAPARVDELLADERTIFLVAFEDGEPVGFVLAYELLRRHGSPSMLFVYEVEVAEPHRGRGVATALLRELGRLARERGVPKGFVLTERANVAAMALYSSAGGRNPSEDVVWQFEYEAD